MPGKHNSDTKLLGFWAEQELIEKIDNWREGDRSQFLREAAVDYLIKKGEVVPQRLRFSPDRAGKGGPVTYKRKKG